MRSLPITLLGVIASVLSSQGVSCTLFDSTFAQPIELRPATSEIESLVRQALEDRLEEEDLPDLGLLGKSTRIAVRQELPATGLRLSQSALPSRDGYDFHLISVRDAQSEAERTQMAIYFITVDRPTIAGDTATIWLGVDFVFPTDPNLVKSCCCVGEAHFRRVEHRWKFSKWGRGGCA